MAAHAFLSASGSKRWMSCPPSAMLETKYPDKGSIYAQEGTVAHELSEITLRNLLGELETKAYSKKLEALKSNSKDFYSAEMADYAYVYVDIVMQKYAEAKKLTHDATIIIEGRLDFSPWVPEGFGTGDAVIIADGRMEIIDLKYGKGVPVSAENNSQMRLYALGAYNSFGLLYDVDMVTSTIVQPRLDSVTTEEKTISDLLLWGEGVKKIADLAIKGDGDFCAGAHCQFCKAAVQCRALSDYNLELAKYEFAHADTLTDEEIADILLREKTFSNWLKAISDYALAEAVDKDKKWPGFKLVEGRSNRVIIDAAAAAQTLLKQGYQKVDVYRPEELRTIGDLEKLTGKKKFGELLNAYIDKPPGKPALVPESDKRPVWSPKSSVEEDFKDKIND
jgi:Protein of unknown function (DUF2800).